MILEIRTKQNKILATITFSEANQPVFLGEFDPEFNEFVSKSLEKGIDRLVDKEVDGKLLTISEPVVPGDSLFSLAFKEFLERSGYEVTERHPEIEKQIKELLATFPNDNPDKQDILERLSDMSHLEQTSILEGLKNLDK